MNLLLHFEFKYLYTPQKLIKFVTIALTTVPCITSAVGTGPLPTWQSNITCETNNNHL